MMDSGVAKRMGDLLVESGRLTSLQLQEALASKPANQKLGEALIELGMLTEQQVADALSEQLNIPSLDSEMFVVDPSVVHLIPEKTARRQLAIPLFLVDAELTVCMADPADLSVIDELTRQTGYQILPVIAPAGVIRRALDEYYASSQSLANAIEEIQEIDTDEDGAARSVQTVNQMLYQAVKLNASDIHVEPRETACRIRFRIDGALHEILEIASAEADVIASRIKILSRLDISEKRIPQDGRFSARIADRMIDFRVSTLPSAFGEKIVLRILDKSASSIGLDKIGLDADELAIIKRLLSHPHGLLLVTGPTGSGKTTTLYGMLQHLNSPDKNLITVEDPIEYKFDGITQVQVNAKIDLTFGRGLRSILRQDPDIIMVGEIRDEETAAIAVRAALTGHFVLSTLHTNDAFSSVGRMIDMGVEPYLLSSSLVGALAQRLVRKVCDNCVRFDPSSDELLAEWGVSREEWHQVASPRGCARCNHTGYRGRVALYEILEIDSSLRRRIHTAASSTDLEEPAESGEASRFTLRESGLRKMIQGETTPQEVARVTAGFLE